MRGRNAFEFACVQLDPHCLPFLPGSGALIIAEVLKIQDLDIAQLFATFTPQTFFRSLARLHFAAGQNQQRGIALFPAEQHAAIFQVQQSSFVDIRHLLQDGEALEIGGHEEASFGDSSRSDPPQFAPELSRVHSAREKGLERGCHLLQLVRGFVDEFQSKVANARGAPGIQVRACLLRLRSKYRIAATHVGHHGMRAALRIPQGNAMLLAGTPAIAVSSARGKKPAEDAMLGVEDREMLIGDGFQSSRANGCGERRDLCGIQIVRRRKLIESQCQIRFRSQGVGGIQAEIADQRLIQPTL